MQIDLEEIIIQLNSISRMAIIENAPETEKMITAFVNFIKYRYQNEKNMAIASKEIKLAKACCEYCETKTGRQIEFILGFDVNQLNSFMVPTFSILSWYYCIIRSMDSLSNEGNIRIETKLIDKSLEIIFEGDVNWESVYEMAYEFLPDEQISIKSTMKLNKCTSVEICEGIIKTHMPLE